MTTTSIVSDSPSMSPVPFHGQTLFVVEKDGQPFVPMRPVAEGMGLDWAAQFTKIKAKPERFCVAIIATQMPGDDQTREVVCLPLRKLPGWLMTINPSKVAPKLRSQVVLYQDECDNALWDFWTKGQATNQRMADASPTPPQLDTKVARKLLNRLIAVWVGLAPLSYKDAWTQVHARIGVASIDDMTNDNIKAALIYVQERIDASQVQMQQIVAASGESAKLPKGAIAPIRKFAETGFSAFQEIEAFIDYLRTILSSVESDRLDGVRALLSKVNRPLDELREGYVGVMMTCALKKVKFGRNALTA